MAPDKLTPPLAALPLRCLLRCHTRAAAAAARAIPTGSMASDLQQAACRWLLRCSSSAWKGCVEMLDLLSSKEAFQSGGVFGGTDVMP